MSNTKGKGPKKDPPKNAPPDFIDQADVIGREIFNIVQKNYKPKTPWDSFIIVLGAQQACQLLMIGYLKRMMEMGPSEPGITEGGIHLPGQEGGPIGP